LKNATAVDFGRRPFTVDVEGNPSRERRDHRDGRLAASPRFGIGEEALRARGEHLATCLRAFFRGKRVVVVGGGDSAAEEANFLTRFCDERDRRASRDALRASKIMQHKVITNPKINACLEPGRRDIHGADAGRVTGVRLRDGPSGARRTSRGDGVFVAIGHVPNTRNLRRQDRVRPKGGLYRDARRHENEPSRAFSPAAMCRIMYTRQAVTARGSGCMAALDAARFSRSTNAGDREFNVRSEPIGLPGYRGAASQLHGHTWPAAGDGAARRSARNGIAFDFRVFRLRDSRTRSERPRSRRPQHGASSAVPRSELLRWVWRRAGGFCLLTRGARVGGDQTFVTYGGEDEPAVGA